MCRHRVLRYLLDWLDGVVIWLILCVFERHQQTERAPSDRAGPTGKDLFVQASICHRPVQVLHRQGLPAVLAVVGHQPFPLVNSLGADDRRLVGEHLVGGLRAQHGCRKGIPLNPLWDIADGKAGQRWGMAVHRWEDVVHRDLRLLHELDKPSLLSSRRATRLGWTAKAVSFKAAVISGYSGWRQPLSVYGPLLYRPSWSLGYWWTKAVSLLSCEKLQTRCYPRDSQLLLLTVDVFSACSLSQRIT